MDTRNTKEMLLGWTDAKKYVLVKHNNIAWHKHADFIGNTMDMYAWIERFNHKSGVLFVDLPLNAVAHLTSKHPTLTFRSIQNVDL